MKTTVIKTTDLPKAFLEVHPHNLYLYCKAYAAGLRANTAKAKTRAEVSGGGKKPFAQKGGGRARQGSITAPHYVGGGVAFGPSTNRNYDQKVNKKQKKLALYHALAEMAANERLFVVDHVAVESGKTKDALAFVNGLAQRDVLVVKEMIDDKTFLAFRNLQNAYLIESNELNAYLAAAYHSIVIEKAVFDKLTKEA
ncbi:MAG TPA: 50S ribosomal protein L4 [Sulfurovum sp.]|jgi:large subunit ribosomal protein L4|nr:MAG: 50S ribosomal protein L4 [Sulfurovum sp. 35-42-20]OYY54530.1 MAG: 50S ribosomal protein L4 [Sulfurovum sp. 28-43-6]OYZ24442.1 MAG: 50S ribosomal protein L4 [Sulfurovum sp. 16-42-52]OYZ48359.1 MAG: 50S ribosomal protein L4 [Sulfurovum sp. 24-42-9]OZA44245.1 MAG: 50S ribosomal protein L4 [Sulfurovum sp. 17-42-90]OZA61196.1 MAG: 50S ribosomal protein L4 [Sulfurovum sp. 39-42-12]HQR73020.1 50S ribosomal protein L4 [Sulfurovum sp.]